MLAMSLPKETPDLAVDDLAVDVGAAARVRLEARLEEAKTAPMVPKRYRAVQALWKDRGKDPVRASHALDQSRDLALLSKVRRDVVTCVSFIRRFQAGERGVERVLLRAHYPMMLQLVRRYSRNRPWEQEDLMQEARLGMLEAFARFDLTHEDASMGYVYQTMKHYVCRYLLNHSEVVRIPIHRYAGEVRHTSKDGKRGYRSKDPVREGEVHYHYGKRNVLCFSEMVDEATENMEHAFEDSLVSEHPLPDEALGNLQIRYLGGLTVEKLLAAPRGRLTLTPAEQRVLRRRFLHDGDDKPTLAEVGKEEGVCRERVRQHEASGLDKLRAGTGPMARRALRKGSPYDAVVEACADDVKEEGKP